MSLAGYLTSGLALERLAGSGAGRELLGSVGGAVFDSTPCELTPAVAARGVLVGAAPSVLGLLEPGGAGGGPAWGPLGGALEGALSAYLSLGGVRRTVGAAFAAWDRHGPACDRLMLYSEADWVVPASGVRAFADRWRARGIGVRERAWAGSRHVEHLRQDADGYGEVLDGFLAGEPAEGAGAPRLNEGAAGGGPV